MEDLDEAMDHFVDVVRCFFSVGLGITQPEDTIYVLESMSYIARGLGPEVAAGLLDLVKEACSEIHSVKLNVSEGDFQEHRKALQSLATLLGRYAIAFQGYLSPHVDKYKEEATETDGIVMEIGLVDPTEDDGQTSID